MKSLESDKEKSGQAYAALFYTQSAFDELIIIIIPFLPDHSAPLHQRQTIPEWNPLSPCWILRPSSSPSFDPTPDESTVLELPRTADVWKCVIILNTHPSSRCRLLDSSLSC